MAVFEADLQGVDDDLSMRPMVELPLTVPEDEPETRPTDSIETSFDPEFREPFTGLLYLGHLKARVHKYGHTFDLSTPTQRERLEAGIIHKRYVNSISGESAWASLVVALYLDAVDDTPLPEPIGPSVEVNITSRFNWVIDNIKHEIINELFEQCLILDSKVGGALDALREASKA